MSEDYRQPKEVQKEACWPALEERQVMAVLQNALKTVGIGCKLASPTVEVPVYVLQADVKSLEEKQSFLAELFLTRAGRDEESDPASSLHLYVTLPLTVAEGSLTQLYQACMEAQTWLPGGCICVYPEDKTIALRDTLYLRGSYDEQYIVDMVLDALEALLAGTQNLLPTLRRILAS